MHSALGLLKERRFLPLFVTQFLGAFNDNLFKQAMVIVVVYQIYNNPQYEQSFTALATAISIIPFFLLSALAGQLADANDKSKIIRIVKTAEIVIMAVGGAGLLLAKAGYTTIGMANTRSCRSISTRMKCWAAPGWSNRRPIWRSCSAPCSPAS
jgi:MFS family permease